MTDGDVAEVRTLLHGTHNLATAIETGAAGGPAGGSQAAEELARQGDFAGPWGPEPLTVVHATAQRLAAAAADHLVALTSLTDRSAAVPPGRTLTGALTQACASVWWVCDPSLGMRGRLARGWTDAWYWADTAGQRPPRVIVSSEALHSAAQQFGFVLLGEPPAALDEWRPVTAELAAAMLGEAPTRSRARLLAAAEGALAGPLGLATGAPVGPEVVPVTPSEPADRGDVVPLAGVSALLYIEAFARWASYLGWEREPWHAWRVHACAMIDRLAGGGQASKR